MYDATTQVVVTLPPAHLGVHIDQDMANWARDPPQADDFKLTFEHLRFLEEQRAALDLVIPAPIGAALRRLRPFSNRSMERCSPKHPGVGYKSSQPRAITSVPSTARTNRTQFFALDEADSGACDGDVCRRERVRAQSMVRRGLRGGEASVIVAHGLRSASTSSATAGGYGSHRTRCGVGAGVAGTSRGMPSEVSRRHRPPSHSGGARLLASVGAACLVGLGGGRIEIDADISRVPSSIGTHRRMGRPAGTRSRRSRWSRERLLCHDRDSPTRPARRASARSTQRSATIRTFMLDEVGATSTGGRARNVRRDGRDADNSSGWTRKRELLWMVEAAPGVLAATSRRWTTSGSSTGSRLARSPTTRSWAWTGFSPGHSTRRVDDPRESRRAAPHVDDVTESARTSTGPVSTKSTSASTHPGNHRRQGSPRSARSV